MPHTTFCFAIVHDVRPTWSTSASLVRVEPYEKLMDALLDHCHQSWGGRQCPIIFFRDDSVAESDWRLMQHLDVDHVHAFAPLHDALVGQIDERLGPIRVEVERASPDGHISITTPGIVVTPTPAVLSSLRPSKLLLFELADTCDPVVRRFAHRNFGCFWQWRDQRQTVRRIAWLEDLLQKIEIMKVMLSDRQSLADFLNLAAGSRPVKDAAWAEPKGFVAACQLGGGLSAHTFLRGALQTCYQLIVGDSPDDLAEHWNGAIWKMNTDAAYAHQLWFPLELMRDTALHDALNNWLRHCTYWGSGNAQDVQVVSHSVPKTELDALAKAVCGLPASPLHCATEESRDLGAERDALLKEDGPPRALMTGSESNVYRRVLHSRQGTFDIPRPPVLDQVLNRDGTWTVEVQVGQDSQGHIIDGSSTTWLLPRRTGGCLARTIFRAPARILAQGTFAVEVSSQTFGIGRGAKPEIHLNLPEERDVVFALFRLQGMKMFDHDDARSALARVSQVVQEVRVSDKGRYLQGLLDLFGGFLNAGMFFERTYWRALFHELAAIDPRKDANAISEIQNLLEKKLPEIDHERRNCITEGIAAKLPGRVRPQDRTLHECERLRLTRQHEFKNTEAGFVAGDTGVSISGIRPVSREEMLDGLNELIERKILYLGVALNCRRCGLRQWCSVDDLKQVSGCAGCEAPLPLQIDRHWSVSLNSLARMAVAQGVIGVQQALAQLRKSAPHSFFFAPSLDLFRAGNRTPWHEIDFVCIADDDLIIGEVKEGKITEADLKSLKEIAVALRPTRAVFFVSREEWKTSHEQALKQLNSELMPQEIKMEMHHLVCF